MSERKERTGTGEDLFGLLLFGAGAFVLALVLLSIKKPFPAEGASGITALAQAVVETLGHAPAGFLALVTALLGARRFLRLGQARFALDLLGTLGVTAGLAILCGAIWTSSGGAVGAATGGALARISPVLGAVLGLLVMAGSAWLIWLREIVPLPGGGDLRRAISRSGRAGAADGVSAAEAEALVVPAPRAPAARPPSATEVRPIPGTPRNPRGPKVKPQDGSGEQEGRRSDATTRTDPAHPAPARAAAAPSAHAAAQPPVRDLAAEPSAAAPAGLRAEPAPDAGAAAALAPATVNPGAAPLRVAPPLGALGVAKPLSHSTSLPRPSWESIEDDEPLDSSPQGELQEGPSVATDTPNTWRPARIQGVRALEDAEPGIDALAAEAEEEFDEALDEDGETGCLVAEHDEELDEDEGQEADEDEDDEEEEEDDEDEDEDEEGEEEEEDEDSARDDSEELEDEDEDEDEFEEDEELEEDAAELEEWEEEDSEDEEVEDVAAELEGEAAELAAELESPARPGSLSPASAVEDKEEVEAELRRLLAEEDARAGAPLARAPDAAEPLASAPARDALQMDLFESPGAASADGSAAAPAPASPAEAGPLVLEPLAPPASARRKPARTPAAKAAAEPRAAAAPRAGDAPAELPTQLLVDAGCLFLDRGRVAVSMLQKTFELDFDRSCEVLDQLQHMGLVGPYMGGQRRDILLTREQWLERIGQPSQGVKD